MIHEENSLEPLNTWEAQIVYQIFPRSFRDGNGDGHGDFVGISESLEGLRDEGYTTILLNPIQKSRFYHNYFADDWFDIDPKYGTLEEFRCLVTRAHGLGLKILLDMEPQYLTELHPWATKPEYQGRPGLVAEDQAQAWYDGTRIRFCPVNLNHPEVVEEMVKLFRFWADLGVDGFRIDHMMDNLDNLGDQTGLLAGLWKSIETALPQCFFVGEQADWESWADILNLFAKTPTQAAFAFRLRKSLLTLSKCEIERSLAEPSWMIPAGRFQMTFLENHDLDRVAEVVPDERKQRLLAGLLMTLKGCPAVYSGQEIGMKGRQGAWGTDGNDIPVRLGYRWSSQVSDPRTPSWYQGTGPWAETEASTDHDGRSVEEQLQDPNSLLLWYRKLLALRRNSPALMVGSQEVVPQSDPELLTVQRTLGEETVLLVANLGEGIKTVKVRHDGVDLVQGRRVTGGDQIELGPWGLAVLKSQSLRKYMS